jgi:hypothetical protein
LVPYFFKKKILIPYNTAHIIAKQNHKHHYVVGPVHICLSFPIFILHSSFLLDSLPPFLCVPLARRRCHPNPLAFVAPKAGILGFAQN